MRRLYAQDIINNYIIMTKEIENIINHTLQYEGGYTVPIAGDKGGETVCGIARNYHPKWEGWKIVDAKKPLKYNQQIPELKPLVMEFYYKNFFLPANCDIFLNHSQALALIVFDFAVNSGISRANKALQTALNKQLSRKDQLKVDGIVGPMTHNMMEVEEFDWHKVAKDILEYRQSYLISIAKGSKAKFLKGWLARVSKLENILKEEK